MLMMRSLQDQVHTGNGLMPMSGFCGTRSCHQVYTGRLLLMMQSFCRIRIAQRLADADDVRLLRHEMYTEAA